MSTTLTRLPLTIKAKPVIKLSAKTVLRCRKLSYSRSNGQMRKHLDRIVKRQDEKALAILAYSPRGKLVGWCLTDGGDNTNFFVHQDYRRLGIGSALLEEVANHVENPYVNSHNPSSKAFFDKFSHLVDDDPYE